MTDQTRRDRVIDAYMATIPLITLNVLWFLASLPVVTAPPAAGALVYATNQLAHGKSAGTSTFFEGFRQYFWRSWQWGILNIVVVAIIVSNYVFYGQFGTSVTIWARTLVVVISFLWLTVQMYTFPLMFEQEKPYLRMALRNSLVVLLKRPFYSMGIALVIAVIAVVSTLVLPLLWALVSASACAYLANLAAVSSIARVAGKTAPSAAPDGSGEAEA